MISFIIVNYRSRIELKKCLHDLSRVRGARSFEIIIVNNDAKPIKIQEHEFEKLITIEINKNIGYAAANNRGVNRATKPYVCLLNPDTHTFNHNLPDIIKYIDTKTIVSPRIISDDGSTQEWCVGNEITIYEIVKNNIGLHAKPWLSPKPITVKWASGAALFMHRKIIEYLDGFDATFFLYFEDVDICYRARHIGCRVLYVPHITLKHSSGASSKKMPKKQKSHYYTSQDAFFKKHHGNFSLFLLRLLRFFHRS